MASCQAKMPLYLDPNSSLAYGVALAELLSSQVAKNCKYHILLMLVGNLHPVAHPYPRPRVHVRGILAPSCRENTHFLLDFASFLGMHAHIRNFSC